MLDDATKESIEEVKTLIRKNKELVRTSHSLLSEHKRMVKGIERVQKERSEIAKTGQP